MSTTYYSHVKNIFVFTNDDVMIKKEICSRNWIAKASLQLADGPSVVHEPEHDVVFAFAAEVKNDRGVVTCREEKYLSEEWREDPTVVVIDSVVVEHGIILALADHSDEWTTRAVVAVGGESA